MAPPMPFIDSLEVVIEAAKFFEALQEKLGGGVIPEGEDGKRLAQMVGVKIPQELADATIEALDPSHATSDGMEILVQFPPRPIPSGQGSESLIKLGPKCWTVTQHGPFGVGTITITVCVTCTASLTSLSCTASIRVRVS